MTGARERVRRESRVGRVYLEGRETAVREWGEWSESRERVG